MDAPCRLTGVRDRKFWRLGRPAEFLDLGAHEGDEFPVVHGGAPVVPSGELRVFEVFVQGCFGPFGPCLDAVWQVALPAVPRTSSAIRRCGTSRNSAPRAIPASTAGGRRRRIATIS